MPAIELSRRSAGTGGAALSSSAANSTEAGLSTYLQVEVTWLLDLDEHLGGIATPAPVLAIGAG